MAPRIGAIKCSCCRTRSAEREFDNKDDVVADVDDEDDDDDDEEEFERENETEESMEDMREE